MLVYELFVGALQSLLLRFFRRERLHHRLFAGDKAPCAAAHVQRLHEYALHAGMLHLKGLACLRCMAQRWDLLSGVGNHAEGIVCVGYTGLLYWLYICHL